MRICCILKDSTRDSTDYALGNIWGDFTRGVNAAETCRSYRWIQSLTHRVQFESFNGISGSGKFE